MDPADVDARLSKIEGKLDEIAKVIGTIAVQQAKIDRIEARVRDAEVRHEQLCSPDGLLATMRNFQASCPRRQIGWLWGILIPMGLSLLGMGAMLLKTSLQ